MVIIAWLTYLIGVNNLEEYRFYSLNIILEIRMIILKNKNYYVIF